LGRRGERQGNQDQGSQQKRTHNGLSFLGFLEKDLTNSIFIEAVFQFFKNMTDQKDDRQTKAPPATPPTMTAFIL
jgi:hypothetical protein